MDASPTQLPSALAQMGRFRRRLEGRRAMVFLDYDGTLTPIVSRPELAQITPGMKALVSKLADRCSVAIVSGRSRYPTLWGFLGLENVIYAGSHGMDIVGPAGHEHSTRCRAGIPGGYGDCTPEAFGGSFRRSRGTGGVEYRVHRYRALSPRPSLADSSSGGDSEPGIAELSQP